MAQKRTGPSEPQSKSKKSRTVAKKGGQHNSFSSSPRKESSQSGEPDDDDGLGHGNQTFEAIEQQLAALRVQQKTQDVWPQQFAKKLDRKQEEALKMLEDVRTKFDNDKSGFENGIRPILETATGPIDEQEADEVPSDDTVYVLFPTTSDQTYIKNLSSLIQDCHTLTSIYHDLANIPTSYSSVPQLESDLNLDKMAVTSSVAAGKKLVARNIEAMLADSFHEVRGRSNMTAEDEARGRQLMMRVKMDDDDMERKGIGFGETAMALEKVVQKMEGVGRRRDRRDR